MWPDVKNQIRRLLLAIFPKRYLKFARLAPRLAKSYVYDFRRFTRHSTVCTPFYDEPTLRALMTFEYHRIEKGLSLPRPRPGFGRASIARLQDYVPAYRERHGDLAVVGSSLAVLASYTEHHRAIGAPDEALERWIAMQAAPIGTGGTRLIRRQDILQASAIDAERFFSSRHSVRNFSPEPVDQAVVERAIALARYAPSVCNRQSGRAYVLTDPEHIARALSHQNGNAGFGDGVSTLLIITSDIRTFFHLGERNQCWVDGGLFAMSVAYALHALGAATCFLNWSVEADTDRRMRAACGIPDNEAVITMMAVGNLPDEIKVAYSTRIDTALIAASLPTAA